ncbi:hypothetical protein D3C73_1523520 [compost metagenome]
MKWEELKPGMPVRISEGHENGYGGRCGKVVAVGTFEGFSKLIAALVDIGEELPVVIDPEGIEEDDSPA